MSFSLKYLFALVALAAIFTAALIYRTSFWTFFAVNLAVAVLLAATIGVWLQRLNRNVWLPFCFMGWFYLALSFSPLNITRLGYYVPSNYVSYILNRSQLEADLGTSFLEEVSRLRSLLSETNIDEVADPFRLKEEAAVLAFRNFADIMHALFALMCGTLAGIISVLLIRPKREG